MIFHDDIILETFNIISSFVGILVVLTCFTSTLHKSFVFNAKSIFGRKIKAEASRKNKNCYWCKFFSKSEVIPFLFLIRTYLQRFIWQALKNYRYDEDPVLAQCGVKIDRQLTQVEGRVLESPKVSFLSFSGWERFLVLQQSFVLP